MTGGKDSSGSVEIEEILESGIRDESFQDWELMLPPALEADFDFTRF